MVDPMISYKLPRRLREVVESCEEKGVFEDWGYIIDLYRADYWHRFYEGHLEVDEGVMSFLCRKIEENYGDRK